MDKLCSKCGKSVDSSWKVCPSCGSNLPLFQKCPNCRRELQPGWKSCPYCGMVIVESVSPTISVKDSVVKEIHQTQQTEIYEAKGATVGGSININVGSDTNGFKTSGTPEYQYEKYVMAILQSGGSIDLARPQLEQRREQLGISLKQSKDVEDHCMVAVNKRQVSHLQNKTNPNPEVKDNHIKNGGTKASGRRRIPLWGLIAGGVVLVGVIIGVIFTFSNKPNNSPVPANAYSPTTTSSPLSVPNQGSLALGATPTAAATTPPNNTNPTTNRTPSAPSAVKYSLNAGVTPNEGGSISPNSGVYDDGSKVTLLATPSKGFQFLSWSGDISGSSPNITVDINSNKKIVANFTPILYSLSTAVNPPGSGSISPNSGSFNYGKQVTLTATPTSGYQFSSWSGDANGTNSTFVTNINGNANIVANFTPLPIKIQNVGIPTTVLVGQSYSYNVSLRNGGSSTAVVFLNINSSMIGDNATQTVTLPGNNNIDVAQTVTFTSAGTGVVTYKVLYNNQVLDTTSVNVQAFNPTNFSIGGYRFSPNPISLGQTSTASITFSGGRPGTYTLQIKEDISLATDPVITSYSINYNGISSTQSYSFTASNRGSFYMQLNYDGSTWFSQPNDSSRLYVK